jgi:hypothetical protein
MRNIGIVGSGADKFTPENEEIAKELIRWILGDGARCVSGHSPVGGIDIWAEEIGRELGPKPLIYPPKSNSWSGGYKQRNIQIAENSDEIHVIVVQRLPEGYTGMRFEYCYHCRTSDHVKSGGCWTGLYAERLGKPAYWAVI